MAGKVADRSHYGDQVSLRQLVVEDVMEQDHPELLVRADVGKVCPGPPGKPAHQPGRCHTQHGVQQRHADRTDEVPNAGLGKNQAVNPLRVGTHKALGHIAAEGGADHMCGRNPLGVEDGDDAGNQVGYRAGRG